MSNYVGNVLTPNLESGHIAKIAVPIGGIHAGQVVYCENLASDIGGNCEIFTATKPTTANFGSTRLAVVLSGGFDTLPDGYRASGQPNQFKYEYKYGEIATVAYVDDHILFGISSDSIDRNTVANVGVGKYLIPLNNSNDLAVADSRPVGSLCTLKIIGMTSTPIGGSYGTEYATTWICVADSDIIDTGARIYTFSFDSQEGPSTINEEAGTISVAVGASRTNLVATFGTSPDATVTVGGVVQLSGVTANNFTAPVTYLVTGNDGTTKQYVVSVSLATYSLDITESEGVEVSVTRDGVEIGIGPDALTYGDVITTTATIDTEYRLYSLKLNTTNIESGSTHTVVGDVDIRAVAVYVPQLATPSVSLTGSVLDWTSVANATSYSILSNGAQIATSSNLMFDISTVLSADGTYVITIVAKAEGYRDSAPSNSVTYIISSVAPVYGVSGLYASAPALTRTDDAVGLSFTINSSSGAIASDFDNLFPWNEATVETINGSKFLHMPSMWFRVGSDSNNRITDIAVSKTQGATGNWYNVESFYYSCYGGSLSGSNLVSVSGANRTVSQTRAQFRTSAANNGAGYFQEDLYHRMVMTFLWWIEWATKDSASIMTGRISGSGTAGGSTVRPTGGTDSVTTQSGFETAYAQMRYHYIEDFVGNVWEFVDGSTGTGSAGVQYVTANPSAFSDSISGLNATFNSPAANGNCIVSFGWDSNNPFLCLPNEVTNDSNYTTYFCDYGATSNAVVLYCGASFNLATAIYGLSYFYRTTASTSYTTFGGRLLFKP